MESKRVPRFDLLRRLLTPLVSEWGAQAVRTTLDELETFGDASVGSGSLRSSNRNRPKREKPSAVSIAEKAILSRDHRASIVALARKFDRKDFLRSAGDIRHFFEMNNEAAPNMKRREDAFRRILEILVQMPPDKIEQLANEKVHGGPARLGPLSEAMRGAGEIRADRNYRDMSTTSQEPRKKDEVPRVEEETPPKNSSS